MSQKKGGGNSAVKGQIVTSNLSVTYFPGQSNEVKSLDNINISISEGEFIIFFGPSGCGKSTLLYSIAGLETGIEGEVMIQGKSLPHMSSREKELHFRNTIGMVFQAFYLIPTLSIIQNVALPMMAAGVKPLERQKTAMDLLTRFGVGAQANKLPRELSGGQQQRVAICRAVVNNPHIILADEPLGNLDSHSANEVVQLLKDLNTNFKKTVILVTHDPTYLDIAHKVFFIKDGKLVDTKINRAVGESGGGLVVKEEVAAGAQQAGTKVKEFKFLSEQYSRLKPQGPSSLLLSYQAKNLATLALADLVVDDFDRLHEKIELALNSKNDFSGVFEFLDVNPEEGGLGLDSRTAKKITKKLAALAKELKIGEDLPHRDDEDDSLPSGKLLAQEAHQEVFLRRAIFDELNIKLKRHRSLAIIDEAITARLRGQIDRKELSRLLNQSFSKGGAALDRRLTNKIVKRLELWLIGHKER